MKVSSLSAAFLILVIPACFVSCDEDHDPAGLSGGAQLELIAGTGQAGATGQLLHDTLRLRIVITNKKLTPGNFVLHPKAASGHGVAIQPGFPDQAAQYLYGDDEGNINVLWRLGCGDVKQKLTFYLYADSCGLSAIQSGTCAPIDSVIVNATATTPHGWNRACGFTWADRYNTQVRMLNGQLYATNLGTLYKLVVKEGHPGLTLRHKLS